MDLETLNDPAYLVCDCHRRPYLMLLDGPLPTQDEAQAQLEVILPECPTAFIARVRPIPEVAKPCPLPEDETHLPFVTISWNPRMGRRHSLKVHTPPQMVLSNVEQWGMFEKKENPNRYVFTLEVLDDDPHWCLKSRPKEKRPDRFASAAAPRL